MRQPIQPVGILDQLQQQCQFGSPRTLRVEPARIQKHIPTIEPVTGHIGRARQEHVQVKVRSQQRVQVTFGGGNDLIGIYRPDIHRIQQLQGQHQQTERRERGTGTHKAQPLSYALAYDQIIERCGIGIGCLVHLDVLIALGLQTCTGDFDSRRAAIWHDHEVETRQVKLALFEPLGHQCRLRFSRGTLAQPALDG
ncbi:hypothetical protein D3C72_1035370 [compost metagenome]